MEYQGMPGEELYQLFINGDNTAFEELVALYEDDVARFINGIVRDYHEAKHLTIETFSQLILNRKKFDGSSSLKTYLFAIGKNLSMRYMKKRGREQHIAYDDIAEAVPDESETPENIIERRETNHLLHAAISELKKEHRVILTLLYFEDMSYLQAGRAMNKSETQIRGLAHRAKAALKKHLEDSGHAWS